MPTTARAPRGDRAFILVVGVLVAVTASLVALAALGMATLSEVRAYVGGEGLWSKAQKDAVYSLVRYAATRDERDYGRFLTAIAVPLGDRRARLELDKPVPDDAVVYAGFAAGGNDPADIPGLARLYRRFRHLSYLERAIRIWAAGDQEIATLRQAADRLHAAVVSKRADPTTVQAILADVDGSNARATQLENAFSRTLGEAARWLTGLLPMIIAGIALLLVGTGVLLSRRLLRQIGASEDALRQANETLRAVIDAAPVAIYSMSLEGEVRFLNPAAERIFGWPAAEALGRRPPFFPTGTEGVFRELLASAEHGGGWTGKILQCTRRDGTAIDVNVSTGPISGPGGALTGIISVTMDVTDVRRLEDQLRHAQKMEAVGQLAGGVAHDFNNLLTAILGSADLLLDAIGPDHPARAEAEEIRNAAIRSADLIRQLLAFSRRQVLAPHVLDLNAVVANLDRMLRRLIGEDIEFLTVLAPDLGAVRADPGQLEQVIINLAVNARDAMTKGGRLTVETLNVELDSAYAREHGEVEAGPYVMLAVSDTGAGMDAATKARVFEPFFTTKEKGKGTGLGLSTVYGIVKQSGGYVWVYSELGQGTTVKTYLPRVAAAPVAAQPSPALPESLGGSETVLVVEDQAEVRRLTRKVLEARGYRVLVASDGPDALRVAGEHRGPIHLLVTDVVMPGMSGREVGLLLVAGRSEMKVLYLSGYADESIVHHGVLEPGLPFLQKPFTPEALARTVRQILDRSSPDTTEATREVG